MNRKLTIAFALADIASAIDAVVEGIEAGYETTRKLFGSRPSEETGQLMLGLVMPLMHSVVEEYSRQAGEQGEERVTNYWNAVAVVYGMAGKLSEGGLFIERARAIRTGGIWAERLQDYY